MRLFRESRKKDIVKISKRITIENLPLKDVLLRPFFQVFAIHGGFRKPQKTILLPTPEQAILTIPYQDISKETLFFYKEASGPENQGGFGTSQLITDILYCFLLQTLRKCFYIISCLFGSKIPAEANHPKTLLPVHNSLIFKLC